MSLMLYFHKLSSFCHKALIALYENATPLESQLVNLGDEADSVAFKKLRPIGKFPVLRDEAGDRTIPESSIIIEYLDQDYPGKNRFIPQKAEHALQRREKDRFYDLHVHDADAKKSSPTGCARRERTIRSVWIRRKPC